MKNSNLLFLGAALIASPLAAQTGTVAGDPAATTPAASAPAATADGTAAASAGPATVASGATVVDTSGGKVGTVTAVANGNATVDTGTVKAAIPVTSFAHGQNGLVLGMTKAQLEAAAAAAKPATIAVGTKVVGPQGNPVGTVAEVNGDLVTVQMPKGKVQLPKTAFAQNANGALAIGMTQAQLEAATAQAAQKPS